MSPTDERKFSIFIPSWNNLDYLRLCVESIEKNSAFSHQILIYVNEGSDGTLEWVRENGYDYVHSPANVGICWAVNSLRRFVKTDYIVYMNDDMYVCPDWDMVLWREIESLPDNKFFLSSTIIQPGPSFCRSMITHADFGRSTGTFREEELLEKFRSFEHPDWFGSTWPPNVVHKDLWDMVGGYSIELSPGMYSDPDFSAKLWLAGVRLFKGLSASRIYHFEARSTGRVKKNNGSLQFLRKYGITSASFMRNVLRRGEPFDESLVGKPDMAAIKKDIARSNLKSILVAGKKNPMVKKLWE